MTTTNPPRVLVVEDDYHVSRIIELALTQLNTPYTYDMAMSADEALTMWHQQGYDLMVTDHNLRGTSGLKLVSTLRAEGIQVPIILVTAYDTPQLEREAKISGVTAYMTKPFIIDELISTIRRLLPTTTAENESNLA